MTLVETVYVSGEGTGDSAADENDLVEIVDGPMTFLGGKILFHVRNSSAGGKGFIWVLRRTPNYVLTTLDQSRAYLEGEDAVRILGVVPVRFDGTSANESQNFIYEMDFTTKRKFSEHDMFMIRDDASSDNAFSFVFVGKISFLSRGGHCEEPT